MKKIIPVVLMVIVLIGLGLLLGSRDNIEKKEGKMLSIIVNNPDIPDTEQKCVSFGGICMDISNVDMTTNPCPLPNGMMRGCMDVIEESGVCCFPVEKIMELFNCDLEAVKSTSLITKEECDPNCYVKSLIEGKVRCVEGGTARNTDYIIVTGSREYIGGSNHLSYEEMQCDYEKDDILENFGVKSQCILKDATPPYNLAVKRPLAPCTWEYCKTCVGFETLEECEEAITLSEKISLKERWNYFILRLAMKWNAGWLLYLTFK